MDFCKEAEALAPYLSSALPTTGVSTEAAFTPSFTEKSLGSGS